MNTSQEQPIFYLHPGAGDGEKLSEHDFLPSFQGNLNQIPTISDDVIKVIKPDFTKFKPLSVDLPSENAGRVHKILEHKEVYISIGVALSIVLAFGITALKNGYRDFRKGEQGDKRHSPKHYRARLVHTSKINPNTGIAHPTTISGIPETSKKDNRSPSIQPPISGIETKPRESFTVDMRGIGNNLTIADRARLKVLMEMGKLTE